MRYSKLISKTLFVSLALLATACSTYDNFTTFFNTYYNAQRLIDETETEFSYQDEKKRVNPKVFITKPEYWIKPDPRKTPILFMADFVIDGRKLQPVKVKLDSVIIKGSKILAKHPNSAYIENTLLLMGQAYFYMSDWINCQVKCSELIDRFPNGDLTPDAHLMIAKTYLVRKKTTAGLTILSRTVDVAWIKKRFDILSEAFRLEAELALFENRFEDALRPYMQAIAQCDDSEQRAKWQVDMAAILYRFGKFERAAKAFQRVKDFSPDYAAKFEADYYYSLCQIKLGNNDIGMSILDDLYNDGKYEEWRDYVVAGRMLNYTLTKNDSLYNISQKYADSAFSASPMIQAIYFEKGMMLFEQKNYDESRRLFSQIRNTRNEYYTTSNRLYTYLQSWSKLKNSTSTSLSSFNSNPLVSDSIKDETSYYCYEFGRVHELLGNIDSAHYYYKVATEIAPVSYNTRAQYLYNYYRLTKDTNPIFADSLYEQLAELYPKTDYGKEAFIKLGYTEHYTIDTVADIFSSGNQLRKNGLYPLSISKYYSVYTNYPDHVLAPKSLYSIGWIFENKLFNSDSALYYYSLLIDKYPKSEFAKDIALSVNYLSLTKSGQTIPDSLKAKKVFVSPKRDYLSEIENNTDSKGIKRTTNFDKQQSTKEDDSIINTKSIINDVKNSFSPKSIIGDTQQKLTNPDSFIPGIKFNNPLDALKKKDSTATQTIKPIEKIKEEKK